MNIFENDVCEAQRSFEKENRKGFWKKLFTLGILNNDYKIEEAQKYLNNCSQDLEKSQQLKTLFVPPQISPLCVMPVLFHHIAEPV